MSGLLRAGCHWICKFRSIPGSPIGRCAHEREATQKLEAGVPYAMAFHNSRIRRKFDTIGLILSSIAATWHHQAAVTPAIITHGMGNDSAELVSLPISPWSVKVLTQAATGSFDTEYTSVSQRGPFDDRAWFLPRVRCRCRGPWSSTRPTTILSPIHHSLKSLGYGERLARRMASSLFRSCLLLKVAKLLVKAQPLRPKSTGPRLSWSS